MKILIVGETAHLEECRVKIHGMELVHARSHDAAEEYLDSSDVVFDFIIDKHPHSFMRYASSSVTVFLNTCMITLAELTRRHPGFKCVPIGFNGFPTLFARECLEVSVLHRSNILQIENVCSMLKTDYLLVEDRIGLVTPRVICMIVNEAFFTVEEGTATRDDINVAMKLGTNYPYGPFEWSERIGLSSIYLLLKALYEESKDPRYKISALMKKEYMMTHSART